MYWYHLVMCHSGHCCLPLQVIFFFYFFLSNTQMQLHISLCYGENFACFDIISWFCFAVYWKNDATTPSWWDFSSALDYLILCYIIVWWVLKLDTPFLCINILISFFCFIFFCTIPLELVCVDYTFKIGSVWNIVIECSCMFFFVINQ